MKFTSVSRWFRGNSARQSSRPAQRVRRERARQPLLETLEDRTLPSVLPPPVVNGVPVDITGNTYPGQSGVYGFTNYDTGGHDQSQEHTPSVAVDPLNPNFLVVAFTSDALRTFNNATAIFPRVFMAYSADRGLTWHDMSPEAYGVNIFAGFGSVLDPTTANVRIYQASTDATVAFDRSHHAYLLYSEHQADPTTGGAVVLERFDTTNSQGGALPTWDDLQPSNPLDEQGPLPADGHGKIIVQWVTGEAAAVNPTMAVDNNVPSFQDTNGALQTDPLSGNVYVAWAETNVPPVQGQPTRAIIGTVSSDGGKHFGTNSVLGLGVLSEPQLVISQGTSDGRVIGGQVTVVADNFAGTFVTPIPQPGEVLASRVLGGASARFNFDPNHNLSHDIQEAGANPVFTDFNIGVNISDPSFTTVDNLQVRLAMFHPELPEVMIQLISPLGTTVTLVKNGLNSNGQQIVPPQGITGTSLGYFQPNSASQAELGLVFDHFAHTNIKGTASAFGEFQPEDPTNGDLAQFFGAGKNAINGTWKLRVWDFVSGNGGTSATQTLTDAALIFTSGLRDPSVPVGSLPIQHNLGPSTFGSDTGKYLLTSLVTQQGIGPGVTVAANNTLGSFDPHQGRIYVAWVTMPPQPPAVLPEGIKSDSTVIVMSFSDDGGVTWSPMNQINDDSHLVGPDVGFFSFANPKDNISEGNRPHLQPTLAVDQATGTLVASWFDGRNDAARGRVARYITASIDGGRTFSTQVFANASETAYDEISQKTVGLEPIPDNESGSNPAVNAADGYGLRQGLAVLAGHIYPVWASNLNAVTPVGSSNIPPIFVNGEDIVVGQMTIAVGPRALGGTMGPIAPGEETLLADGITKLAYNNTFDSAHIRQFTGFLVSFDRPIDPNTFGPAQVTVIYHDPTTPANQQGIPVAVAAVTAVYDPNSPLSLTQQQKFGPSRFLITLVTPQTGTGTYSYAIGPNIRDRIRQADANGNLVATGNKMDENSNAVAGENPGDVFDIPHTLSSPRVLFTAPYDQDTLPIIIPGPHVVRTSVPGQPASLDNLVLNATNNAIDVVFDRNMQPGSFTAAQVLRIIGPAGVVPGPYTIIANPNGTDPDPNFPRTFRIIFPITPGAPSGVISGTYTVQLSPTITAKNGDHLDQNQNAGLDNLRTTSPGATTTPVTFNSSNVPVVIPVNSTVTSNLTVNDNFAIQGLTLTLNITFPNDPDLVAVLIAPDGTRIHLFTHVGNSGAIQGFSNTTFDDNATVPIQAGGNPFNGSFNPQTPLSVLLGKGVAGTYQLQITNTSGTFGGTLTSWSMTFRKAVVGTGLGEPAADIASASFRIFNMDVNNPLSRSEWTAVGPASLSSQSTGQATAIAVDPSDPTGNTVYVGGNGGGVWKTNNFLTTDPQGPTYIPLTDFGPTFGAMDIGGLVVAPRNNNPNQSIVFAATGAGDNNSWGIGFLRSLDGGAHWTLLDSSTNVDSTGNELPINDPRRDHIFAGSAAFKIVADPTPSPSGDVILYAALADLKDATGLTRGGIWRSLDSGKHWQHMLAGQATDVLLAPDSATAQSNNLQVVFAALRSTSGGGQTGGVFLSPNQGSTWNLMAGSVGDPLIRDGDVESHPQIQVTATLPWTGSNVGRIALATPFLTGNPVADKQYEGWVYAAVEQGGGLFGLFLTKDFGQNWTKIKIPVQHLPVRDFSYPSNDETLPDYNVENGAGAYSISLAIDPTNPNVVYLGGTIVDQPLPSGGLIRVDATGLNDAHALVAFDNNDSGTPVNRTATKGSLTLKNPTTLGRDLYGLSAIFSPGFKAQFPELFDQFGNTPILNLLRDPVNPFLSNATIYVTNSSLFNNDGGDARGWEAFGAITRDINGFEAVHQHRILTIVDPLTGHARLLFATDQGVYSGVDRGDGTLEFALGSAGGSSTFRSGNLQFAHFTYGATQPSILAASIAGGLFYGNSFDIGPVHSTADVLSTGNIQWLQTHQGSGTTIATDQTGSGTVYQFQWPFAQNPTNFFQVQFPGGNPISRTFGLFVPPTPNLPPQWPLNTGFFFEVNPINGNQIILGDGQGRLFRTEDQGLTWFSIGEPTAFETTAHTFKALAFGAPDPAGTGGLDNFIYAGTDTGHIYVTFNGGGGGAAGSWINLSAGLDGSSIQAIVADPVRGSHDAYAVTSRGVYRMLDSSAPNATWQNITGQLFSLKHTPFGNSNLTENELQTSGPGGLTSIAADWRIMIPDNPSQPNSPLHPVLYVGGIAGVYKSRDLGSSWFLFPSVARQGAFADGGFLPVAHVSSLRIAYGNINPTTGLPDQSGGPAVLYATTNGRGAFAIRLPNNVGPGPRVVSFTPTQSTGPLSQVTVTFDKPVDISSFTVNKISVFQGPGGPITATQVTDVDPTNHKIFVITFPTQSAAGTYTITFGPGVQDFAGDLMDQNGNGINGEASDSFTGHFSIHANFAQPEYIVGADAGGGPEVKVFNAVTGQKLFDFFAYNPAFPGGVRVALGDVNNDGTPDIITAAGPGGGPHIEVFDGVTGVPIYSFFAYDPAFTGGVFVASGDVNGDGFADVITGKGAGSGPRVRVFSGKDSSLLQDFFAYDAGFTGGVQVAAGDVNGDGYADVVTGAGPGGGPHVIAFSGKDHTTLDSFFAFNPTFTGGVYVATGDVNGDGRPEIITGMGKGGPPTVNVFSGVISGQLLNSFLAFDKSFLGGVRVGSLGDLNNDGGAEIIVGAGPGGGPQVSIFDSQTLDVLHAFYAFDPHFTGGVYVGGQ